MLRNFKVLAIVALLAVSTGCYTVGVDYNDNAAASIKAGQNESDVIASLGQPTYVTNNSDGSKVLTWSYVTGSNFLVASDSRSKSLEVTVAGGRVTNVRNTYSSNYHQSK